MVSSPANTVMISELGFVYFLERTEDRNVLRVYRGRAQPREIAPGSALGSHNYLSRILLATKMHSKSRVPVRKEEGLRTYI